MKLKYILYMAVALSLTAVMTLFWKEVRKI